VPLAVQAKRWLNDLNYEEYDRPGAGGYMVTCGAAGEMRERHERNRLADEDGLPKLRDFSAAIGGSGAIMPE
jgi:hypothetical protein